MGVAATEEHYDLLIRYIETLREWNSKINLVSRKDVHRIFTYHIVDSLAVTFLIPKNARTADIGTGAGLPGVPLAIVRPDIHMLLIESIRKKCRFLDFVVSELGLKNAEVISERVEALKPLGCDVILSRLTGPLPKILKYAVPHLKIMGTIIIYKTQKVSAELDPKTLQKLNLTVVRTVDLTLPLSLIPRRFVVLQLEEKAQTHNTSAGSGKETSFRARRGISSR